MYLIEYQKKNGDIIQRKRSTMPPYAIGGETSMGWKLLDIKYGYKDKYYNLAEYNNLVHHRVYKKSPLKKLAYWIIKMDL